jgi:hypothetical protein
MPTTTSTSTTAPSNTAVPTLGSSLSSGGYIPEATDTVTPTTMSANTDSPSGTAYPTLEASSGSSTRSIPKTTATDAPSANMNTNSPTKTASPTLSVSSTASPTQDVTYTDKIGTAFAETNPFGRLSEKATSSKLSNGKLSISEDETKISGFSI